MSARRLLRLLHGWIGVTVAAFVILVAASGASLAFMSEMFSAQYGDVLRAHPPVAGAPHADLDRMIASAEAAEGAGFQPIGVLMPHSRVPGAETAMVFGSASDRTDGMPAMVSLDPWTAAHKGSFNLGDAFGHTLIDFHHELFAGEVGHVFVAALGLLLALFAATGLWLWWPRDGRVWRKAAALELAGGPRRAWFSLHGWLGVWLSLAIILFAVTGTATAKPSWFGPLLSDEDDYAPSGSVWARACEGKVSPGDAARAAARLHPERRLTMFYFGRGPNAPYQMMLKGAGDLNRMEGDVVLWAHRSCPGLIHWRDLGAGSAADRAGAMMSSLHGGYSFGPMLGPTRVLVTGLALVLLSGSGVYVFFTRTLRRRAAAPAPAGRQPAK